MQTCDEIINILHVCFSFVSVVIAVGRQEPLSAAVFRPARVISTSCVLVPRTVCSNKTGRCTATNTGILSVQRFGYCTSVFDLIIFCREKHVSFVFSGILAPEPMLNIFLVYFYPFR